MKARLLFISGREVDYIRNRVIINALQRNYDVTIMTGEGNSIPFRTCTGLVKVIYKRPQYDVVFAGFYAQPIVIVFSLFQNKPIIFDAYVSTFDTLCEDRGWFRPTSVVGKLAFWLDQNSCKKASAILTDTKANSNYFNSVLGAEKNKLSTVYVGYDESVFFPRHEVTGDNGSTTVFYYGAFLRLHGTEIIIQAANKLRDVPEIRFILGGTGKQVAYIRKMVSELDLPNVELVGWIPYNKLPDYISQATICLGGHFSQVPKATRVISTKTFQFMAMRKPTIIADNPATRELFTSGEHAYSVPMGDPDALANAIQVLAKDRNLCQHIADGGYNLLQQKLSAEIMARELDNIIKDVM